MSQKSSIIDGGFLQSEYWENFQRSLDRKVIRLENGDNQALLIQYQLPVVGGYFFVPRGPIMQGKRESAFSAGWLRRDKSAFAKATADKKGKEKTIIEQLIDQMILTAKESKVGWVRVEPQSDEDLEMIKKLLIGTQKLVSFKMVKATKDHEPAQTLMLALDQPEDQLLVAMKQKTRYNIRLAEKHGVEIFESRKKEDIDTFCQLTRETAKRDGIVPHPESYYKKMLETIPEKVLKLYFARYKDQIIASAMVSFYGEVATYLHGASANEYRNVMAPYLIQWQAIKQAKIMGMQKYDFGGVKIGKREKVKGKRMGNSWEGITRFKLGFCDEAGLVDFPGCYDIIVDSKKYWLYRLLQQIKGIFR